MKSRLLILLLIAAALVAGRKMMTKNDSASSPEIATLPAATPPKLSAPVFLDSQRIARPEIKQPGNFSLLEELASRKNERIVRFKSDAAYRRTLVDLEKKGFKILARLYRVRALRIGYDDLSRLEKSLGDDAKMSRNYLVSLPPVPEGDVQAGAVGFGNDTLSFLGIGDDNSTWGKGVTIAILDTGVVAHPAIPADFKQLSLIDSPAEPNGHGTAVASLASAVAPSAKILSIQIADENGSSDSFTLAQGIFAALENGAQVINVSMGSPYENGLVADAINAAREQGAVVVASSGNNGLEYATSPASNENVISVGAIDAKAAHLDFSNSFEGLSTSAPGYEVFAAWPGDRGVAFTGTSASSPLTAGGIAAVMSQVGGNAQGAAQILLANSNEAGAPGADSQFGLGYLDIGRAVNSSTRGIYDLAVASTTLANNGLTGETLQVSVENRGTETLLNSRLDLNMSGQHLRLPIPRLAPAERQVLIFPAGNSLSQNGALLSVSSSVSVAPGVRDGNSANNSRADVITPNP